MAYLRHLFSNKLFLVFIFFLVLGIGVFKSCQAPTEHETQHSPLEYEKITFKLPETLPDTLPIGFDSTIYWLDYVKFDNDSLNHWIFNNIIFDERAQSIQEDADMLFAAQKEAESMREGIPFAWIVEHKLSVDHAFDNYIGFTFHTYSYLGGAHGNYATKFLHWDVKKQHEILAHDFFDQNQHAELQQLGEKVFRQKFNLADTASLENDYFFENGVFRLPENVQILENGDFQFAYGLYEILPYVNGETFLQIPGSEIKPFLSELGLEIWTSLQNKK